MSESKIDRIRSLQKRLSPVVSTTTPYHASFPNINQSKHCWALYVVAQHCYDKTGYTDRSEPVPTQCIQATAAYKSICPNYWIEDWDKQVDDGIFPRFWPEE